MNSSATPAAPRRMDMHEKLRLRTASYRVTKLGLPPATAELVRREIMAWEEFGYWLGTNSVVRKAVDEIMKWPTSEVGVGDRAGNGDGESKIGVGGGRGGKGRAGGGAVGYE